MFLRMKKRRKWLYAALNIIKTDEVTVKNANY